MTDSQAPNDEAAPVRPFLQIVRGDPTPAELAAVIAVLSSAGAQAEPEPEVSAWASPAAMHRVQIGVPGPNAWVNSSRR